MARAKPLKTYSVPIYTGRVELYTDWDDFAANASFCGEELSQWTSGCTIASRNKSTNERIYMLGVFDGTLQTAIHEMAHVAMMLLEDVGVKANEGMGEPFCYLLDSIWKYFEKALLEHTQHG